MTQKSKDCKSHQCHKHHHDQSPKNEVEHIISLLQQKFISPYKLIYMIDQKQADYFKVRNKLDSCCSSNDITIPRDELTKLQKIVVDKVSRGHLLTELQGILTFCHQRFQSIKKDGQKTNLEFNDQVQKFLLDKVLSQGVHMYLLKQITQQLKEQNSRNTTQMGLWATPATWYAQYPNTPLNFLSSQVLSNLINKGQTICQNFFSDEKQNLQEELSLIEKDGKFEEMLWKDTNRNDKKVLTSPELYVSEKETAIRFPRLKTTILMLKAIPFELNAKANAFCTVSEVLHISYYGEAGFHRFHRDRSTKYSLLSLIGAKGKFKVRNAGQELTNIQGILNQGDLLIVDSQAKQFEFTTENHKKCFAVRFWINCIQKN